MRGFVVLILLFCGSFSIGQNSINARLILTAYEAPHQYNALPNEPILIYSSTDTFNFVTNEEGEIMCATDDGLKTIELNQIYYCAIADHNEPHLIDSFSTFTTVDTIIHINLDEGMIVCTVDINPISFIDNTLEFSESGKADFSQFSFFVHDAENTVVEIYGNYNSSTSSDLAYKRSQLVRDSLIAEGVFPDRLKVGKPVRNDTSNNVEYDILSFDYTPCTGGSVINFDKITDTIVETRCDSLRFIANYINIQKENFAVIGIYTIKDDRAAKQKAIERAEVVRVKLIALGIDENRLRVKTAYYKEPEPGNHRDWPFYPSSYSYEIGVYVLGDY